MGGPQRHAGRVFLDDAAQQLGDIRRAERHLAGEQLEHGHAQTVEVGAGGNVGVPGSLLGGHVGGRAVHAPALTLTLVTRRRAGRTDTEVQQRDLELAEPVAVQDDVLGLHVAVHVPRQVDGVQDGGDAHGDDGGLADGQGPEATLEARQALAIEALEHQEGRAILEQPVIQNRDDAGVKDRLSHLGFALESRHEIRVVCELRAQRLHHQHGAIALTPGFEDDARPAHTNASADPVHPGKKGAS